MRALADGRRRQDQSAALARGTWTSKLFPEYLLWDLLEVGSIRVFGLDRRHQARISTAESFSDLMFYIG
jgi:hypothetical protein